MKRTIKVSMMAVIAMFAFSTVADAQFGGLLKGASKAVGSGLIKGKKKTKAENVEVMNWKAGQMVTVENPFNPEAKPWKSDTNFGTYIKYDKRYLVTDWQHKDDADPMAQYK